MAAELRDVSIGTALHASMVELTRAARDLDGLSAFGRPVIVRASTEERAAVIDFKLSTSPPTTVALTFGEGNFDCAQKLAGLERNFVHAAEEIP